MALQAAPLHGSEPFIRGFAGGRGVWIPACAGMTRGCKIKHLLETGEVARSPPPPSRGQALRGDDEKMQVQNAMDATCAGMTKIVGSDARFAQHRSLQSHTITAAPLQHPVIPAHVGSSSPRRRGSSAFTKRWLTRFAGKKRFPSPTQAFGDDVLAFGDDVPARK